MAGLTKKEEIFVREYLVDFNATRSAICAGYAKNSARVTGSRLLTKANIRQKCAELTKLRITKLDLDADRTLQELARIGLSNIKDVINEETGCVKPVHEMDDNVSRAIKSIKVREEFDQDGEKKGELVEVNFWDKMRGLELTGKHHKLFTEQMEVTFADDLATELRHARERKEKKKNGK